MLKIADCFIREHGGMGKITFRILIFSRFSVISSITTDVRTIQQNVNALEIQEIFF